MLGFQLPEHVFLDEKNLNSYSLHNLLHLSCVACIQPRELSVILTRLEEHKRQCVRISTA